MSEMKHTCSNGDDNEWAARGCPHNELCLACDIELCRRTLREDPLPGNRFIGSKALDRIAEALATRAGGGEGERSAWELGYERGYDDREKMDHDRADVIRSENPFGAPPAVTHPEPGTPGASNPKAEALSHLVNARLATPEGQAEVAKALRELDAARDAIRESERIDPALLNVLVGEPESAPAASKGEDK